MTKLKIVGIMISLFACTGAIAQSASRTVNVNATVTSACRFKTSGPVALTATYPAFSEDAVERTQNLDVECTRGSSTNPTFAFTEGPVGTVGGLTFVMSTSYAAGDAGTPPAGSSATDLGTPRTGVVTVKASFPANQAGTTGTNTAVPRTLTISF